MILQTHRTNGVLTLTLNRPEARNALSTALLTALVEQLNAAQFDDEIRCTVITGGNKVFAAGADVLEMAQKDMQAILLEQRPQLFAQIAAHPKPIVAAVCGYALGGGCELAMLADIIIAGQSAQLGQPEINLGIIPGAGGTQRLTRQVGKNLAMKIILAGEFISAQEALRTGLVAEVTDDEACLPRAQELAQKISSKAPLAVRLAKEAILQAYEMPLSQALAVERRNFVLLAGTDDRNEGIAAFIEKRPANWRGH